tara:strand:+ start:344 stop:850 length:507 start_codon:yes stop_codon:yes gene_type:complete
MALYILIENDLGIEKHWKVEPEFEVILDSSNIEQSNVVNLTHVGQLTTAQIESLLLAYIEYRKLREYTCDERIVYKAIAESMFQTDLAVLSLGSTDFDDDRTSHVSTLKDAQKKLSDFTEELDLGSSNFLAGQMFLNGKYFGYLSYNTRYWDTKQPNFPKPSEQWLNN